MPTSSAVFLEFFNSAADPIGRGQSSLELGLTHGNNAMSLFRKVVVPLGLVADSEAILNQVAGLAARFQSEIVLLQLFPHTCKMLHESGEVAHLRNSLSHTAHQFVKAGVPRVYAALLEGNASYHIEEAARQHQASLILISEERNDNDAQPWFGTITQRLSRRAHIPLLVVKPDASLAMSPVLCVVDFSESSHAAISYALELTRAFSTRLLIQHVVPEPAIELNEGPLWKAESAPSFSRESVDGQRISPMQQAEVKRKIEAAQAELANFTAELDLSDVNYETQVVCGSLVAETIFTARAQRAGVVVMESSRRGGFTAVESQTPAEAVAEIAEMPILISHCSAAELSLKADASIFARKTL
jgi:nucleotide-binding universal stress UspA family protein